MKIEVKKTHIWQLIIDGLEPLKIYCGGKTHIRKYLKRNYNIDLRTDKRIIKNYVEKETRLIKTEGKNKILVNRPL